MRTRPTVALTAPLRRELRRALPERPFEIRFWDGTVVPATVASAPVFRLRAPLAIAHMLRSPSRLGLGRAYVEGSLDTEDLDEALAVVDDFEPPPIAAMERLRLAAGALAAAAAAGVPRRPAIELVLRGERHTVARDAAAVRYHYDAGNEFFALFLDRSMTYSCALFRDGAGTLEEAQRAKLELVARKLRLRPGGESSTSAAAGGASRSTPRASTAPRCSASPSLRPQAALARERVMKPASRTAWRSGSPTIESCASRHSTRSQASAWSSMWARARSTPTRASSRRSLAPGGALLNHGIAALRTDEDASADPFTNRYVFPDGEPLHLSRVQLALERAGLASEHVEGFVDDYALTLGHWARRLDERLDDARALAGPERTRVWRLYLRGARRGFKPATPPSIRCSRGALRSVARGSGLRATRASRLGAPARRPRRPRRGRCARAP